MGALTSREALGATLVEVVVATAVLAIVSLGLVSAILTAVRAEAFRYERSVAASRAQREVAELRLLSAADLAARDGSTFPVEGLSSPNGAARGTVRAIPLDATLYQVIVEVRWRGAWGEERLDMETVVAGR